MIDMYLMPRAFIGKALGAVRKVEAIYRRATFRPYIKRKNIEGVWFDFLIGDCDGQDWYDLSCTDPEWIEMRFIRDYLVKEGDVIFECGGHHGCTAILLAKWAGEMGKVITFEPNPNNSEIIRKNISMNKINNVIIENKAVGASNGKTFLSAASNASVQKNSKLGPIVVEVVNLDKFIDLKPTFLKIDVEGYEVEVLKGAKKILKNHPKLAIEIHTISLSNYGTSIKELLELLFLEDYDCWVQWDDSEIPKRFDRNQDILTRVHLFAVPKVHFHEMR